MAWHELLAWAIITVAFGVAILWCVRRFMCPASECDKCERDCKRRTTK